jgi:DNA-binding beta-propeller fold protein YncE
VALLAVALLAAGCATAPKTAQNDYYFFPPPPDEPHLQFLMGFNTERELGANFNRSFLQYLTGQAPRAKDISKPYGMATSNHKLYVCDTDYGAILIADLKSKTASVFPTRGQGMLKVPLNLAIDPDGNFYVADSGRDQVLVYGPDYRYLAAIGRLGEMKPRDVAVDGQRIYIADVQNHKVHVLDRASKKLLFDIPRGPDTTNAPHRLYTPTNLALDSAGKIYVSDTGAFHVQVYDADGRYLRSVGSMGDSLGQFARIKGIAVDREARVYAVDSMSEVGQIFDDQGRLLTWFAEPGVSGSFKVLPAKVMVDYDDVSCFSDFVSPDFRVEYLVIVANQIGPHRISIYGFGHPK